MLELINSIVNNPEYKDYLSIIKGLRNGIVYGIKIRFPHALVMTFLFNKKSIKEKLFSILKATWLHSKNLGLFVFLYKLIYLLLKRVDNKEREYHTFISGFLAGYLIFGKFNEINRQITLYLFGRAVLGLTRLAVKNRYLPSFRHAFPLFAAINWGLGMWEFDQYPRVLLPSVLSSMTYIYRESHNWTGIWEYFFR